MLLNSLYLDDVILIEGECVKVEDLPSLGELGQLSALELSKGHLDIIHVSGQRGEHYFRFYW